MKSILVTGSNGFVGNQVVNALLEEGHSITGVSIETESRNFHKNFTYVSIDLTNVGEINRLFDENEFSHVIHLAAIAHVVKGIRFSWSNYYRVNTLASTHIFELAASRNIPIFFSSTVDIYGIQRNEVDENTMPKPIGSYAKSKFLAEKRLIEISVQPYLIGRFAPIYSVENKKDIRKRYYLKYPNVCFLIGDGMKYDFLSLEKAKDIITSWVMKFETMNGVINICDDESFNTRDLIEQDKISGLKPIIIKVPKLLIKLIYIVVNISFSKMPMLRFSAYKIIKPLNFSRINKS